MISKTHCTVPIDVLHKKSHQTAYIKSLLRLGSDLWQADVDMPFASTSGEQGRELLHALEVVRQSGLAIAHLGLEVPLGFSFTLQEIEFQWSPLTQLGRISSKEICNRVVIEVSRTELRKGILHKATLSVQLFYGETLIGDGGGTLVCLSSQQYRAIRRLPADWQEDTPKMNGPSLLDPTSQPSTISATLGWNNQDPLAFDHEVDHIPGISILESGILAASQLMDLAPRKVSFSFQRFIDFSPSAHLTAKSVTPTEVSIRVTQLGIQAVTGVVSFDH